MTEKSQERYAHLKRKASDVLQVSDNVDEENFAILVQSPVFLKAGEMQPTDCRTRTAFVCDKCITENIDPIITCYQFPDMHMCLSCYAEARKACSAPEVVAQAEKTWDNLWAREPTDEQLNSSFRFVCGTQ